MITILASVEAKQISSGDTYLHPVESRRTQSQIASESILCSCIFFFDLCSSIRHHILRILNQSMRPSSCLTLTPPSYTLQVFHRFFLQCPRWHQVSQLQDHFGVDDRTTAQGLRTTYLDRAPESDDPVQSKRESQGEGSNAARRRTMYPKNTGRRLTAKVNK